MENVSHILPVATAHRKKIRTDFHPSLSVGMPAKVGGYMQRARSLRFRFG